MDYPLYIGGEEKGRLRVESQGLYTVFEAELGPGHDELVRLWLHGGGGSAYLGLMQPWSGGLYLRRKLSRNELEGFPKPIEYAADRPAEPVEERRPQPAALQCPYPPEPVPEQGEGLLWYRRPDGSLVAHDGKGSLVALPARLRRSVPGAQLRQIEGQEYMVFRY